MNPTIYNYILPWWLSSNESACSAGDTSSIPGSGRSPEEGKSNPLQYSCLKNPQDRGVWWATVQGVTKSQTWLSTYIHTNTHTHTLFINYVQISYLNLGLQIQLLVGFYSSLFRSPKPNPPPTPIYIKVIRGHRWHRTVTLATFLHAVFTKWNNITWILLF